MFRNLFANIPDVTKNLLILNGLFFLAKIVFEGQGIYLGHKLGMHYPSSEFFEPYQIITHFFMHGDFFHIMFNMVGLVVFGSQLERVWGKKRFFIFYFVTAIGAVLLHTIVQAIEIHQLVNEWFPTIYTKYNDYGDPQAAYMMKSNGELVMSNAIDKAWLINYVPVVGASGAVYGLLMAFALLFPNTQFMLLFPPIPIKAKWLALILGGIAVYSGFLNSAGDSVAHFAHLGGMLFGFILIRIWKRDNSNFY